MKKIILKSIILVLGIVFFYACSPKSFQSSTNNFQGVDTVSVSYLDSTIIEEVETVKEFDERRINIDSVLNANIDFEDQSTLGFFYNAISPIGEYELYSGQVVAFARLEKERDIFAIVCPNVYSDENAKIDFYILQDIEWKYLNSTEVYDVDYFQFVDLNNDGIIEIQTIGHPNMNGNYWNNFYSYSEAENKFIEGGGFFSSMYEFKNAKSRVEVEYGGSWYMPESKTIYYWKNHKLIPYKEVEVGLKIADMRHQARYIKYSENLNLDKDSVQLIYKKTYRGKKTHNFFDNFFENN